MFIHIHVFRDAGELELAADCYRRHLLAEDGTDDPLSTQTPYLAPQDEQIDPERAEALLFLASHHRGLGELDIAEKYGSR